MKAIASFLFLIYFSTISLSQTLYNQIWEESTGLTKQGLDHMVSDLDTYDNRIIAGNRFVAGENENVLISKLNSEGAKE